MSERARAAFLVLATAFRADPRRAAAVLLLNLGVSLSSVMFSLWMKVLVDGATQHDRGRIFSAAAGLAITFAVLGVAGMSQYVLASRLSEVTSQAFDEELIRISARLPGIEHHERPEYLDKLNLLRTDRWTLSSSVWALFINLGLVTEVVGTVLLLARIDLLMLLLPVFAVPYVWLAGKAQVLALDAGEKAAEPQRMGHSLRQLGILPGPAKEIRVAGLQETLLRLHGEAAAAALAPVKRAQQKGALYNALGAVIFAVGFAAATLLVVFKATRGQASLGDVVLAMTLAARVNQQVSGTVSGLSWLLQSLRGVSRFLWLRDYSLTAGRQEPGSAPVPAAIRSGIDLQDVAFRYPGTEVDVLRDFSLHVPAGSTVAIVGENGAGKTSLIKLLLRFYHPTSGRILLDGVDIREFDVEAWRARHSACFQDFTNFAFSLREAVGVGDLPQIENRPRIEAALAAADAADLPGRLSKGLETQLTKQFAAGEDLSGGQWQKLALGRAMMRQDPLVLALDEPSSGLDAEAEHLLFERYAGAARRGADGNGAITVLVSHRFSTVRMADLIVVVADGRPAEVGNHQELMHRRGLYAELFEIQASAYR
ncbi:MAG: ABC transporter ATP-binding protein [Candidatus Dormibacteria bacterium]